MNKIIGLQNVWKELEEDILIIMVKIGHWEGQNDVLSEKKKEIDKKQTNKQTQT